MCVAWQLLLLHRWAILPHLSLTLNPQHRQHFVHFQNTAGEDTFLAAWVWRLWEVSAMFVSVLSSRNKQENNSGSKLFLWRLFFPFYSVSHFVSSLRLVSCDFSRESCSVPATFTFAFSPHSSLSRLAFEYIFLSLSQILLHDLIFYSVSQNLLGR